MKWFVEVAEYAGDDYWYDYPPFEFDTEVEARAFAGRHNDGNSKIRDIYSRDNS